MNKEITYGVFGLISILATVTTVGWAWWTFTGAADPTFAEAGLLGFFSLGMAVCLIGAVLLMFASVAVIFLGEWLVGLDKSQSH